MTEATGVYGGRYRALALLGKGGFGAVYRAEDANTGRHVALKLLHGGLDQTATQRFVRKAQIVQTLAHPNIVRMFDFGEDVGGHFIVYELLEGETLTKVLKAGPLSIERAVLQAQLSPGPVPLPEAVVRSAYASVIRDAAQKSSEARHQNAALFLRELRSAAEVVGVSGHLPGQSGSAPGIRDAATVAHGSPAKAAASCAWTCPILPAEHSPGAAQLFAWPLLALGHLMATGALVVGAAMADAEKARERTWRPLSNCLALCSV